MTVRARTALFAAILAAAWTSAGPAPLLSGLVEARTPVDFARDYVTARARLDRGRGAVLEGEAANAYAETVGAPQVVLLSGPYHLHPPPALLPVLPLGLLPFAIAALAWLALSFVALAALAFMLAAAAARVERPAPSAVAALLVLLCLWPPVLYNVAKGQWSILLAALIAGGWQALARGHERAAGVWLGAAACVKVTPGLLIIFLALRHRRAAAAMAATIASAVVAASAFDGLEPWMSFLANGRRDVEAWQTWIANTASLQGFVARLLAPSAFTRPLVEAPAAVNVVGLAAVVVLVGLAIAATRVALSTPAEDRRLFAVWTTLTVLLNPLAWSHTLIIALVPLALLADAPRRTFVAAALVVFTLPRETLAALAGPLPVPPGRALVLSLHAGGLLLLLAAARAAGGTRGRDRKPRMSRQ